jgi:hypothetical protein
MQALSHYTYHISGGEYVTDFPLICAMCSFSTDFARELYRIALSSLARGFAAIWHCPLGVWHSQN